MKSPSKPSRKSPKTRRRRTLKIVLVVVALLIVFRLFLPSIVLHYVNKSLATMNGYYGHVTDIDIALLRGAYVIDDIFINRLDSSRNQTPFFASDVVDLSIEWGALFHGRLVGELVFLNPTLRFTRDKTEPGSVAQDTADFRRLLDDLMPLKVNRFEADNGRIQFIDSSTTPVVDLSITRTHVLGRNLSSVRDTALLPAEVKASGDVYQGRMNFMMKLDPLADDPTYDLNAEVTNTHLPDLNNFFKAYANFDVNKGTFGMYMEMAAKDRKFKGYVKPIIKDLDVVGPEDRHDSFLQKIWEHLVGAAGVILKNRKYDQIATKIPIEGTYDQTIVGTWYAITHVLKNAFIQAIYPSLDYQITIASVAAVKPKEKPGFFERVFGGGSDEKKEKSGKKESKRYQKR